jgi:[ribosomal protein S5]-alanine N-acetyltransferase
MNVIIQTPRLLLRLFTEDDAPLLYELNLDPEVTKYTYDPIRDTEHARQVLEQVILPQYALYNYGRWAVHLKKELKFIGWCGLKFIPGKEEIDLGYRFIREEWGKGYATEAAYGCIQYGFQKLGLRRIGAHAVSGNLGSLKVLENCGMSCVGEEMEDGHLLKTYQIFNPFIR